MTHEISTKKFELSAKASSIFAFMVLIGIVSFIAGLKVDSERAWASYLVGYFVWLCVGLSGVFFTALQHITASRWSATVRRIAEAFIAYIPMALVLFLILLLGADHLFEWIHGIHEDPHLALKAPYLNKPMFIVRGLLLFAWVLGMGGWMVKNSLKQDETHDAHLTMKNRKIAAPFIAIFAWLFTFTSIDLMMSLSPHWFSTIFGVYCFAGLFCSGLAMLALWAIQIQKSGVVGDAINQDHIHDIGKLMFAFTVFWAYVAFSQFMLIWYGNLPEETFYFLARLTPSWKPISIALVILKFVFPLFALIGRPAKRNTCFLTFMGVWFLLVQWLDIYWLVYPTFEKTPVFGWIEVGVFAGFAGLFFLSVGWFLKRVNPVAVGDPFLQDALHHHQ